MTTAIDGLDDQEDDNYYSMDLSAAYMNKLDAQLAELSKQSGELTITQMEQLILKISTLIHQTQKKLTKEIATSHEKARDAHVKENIGHMRGRTMVAIHLASGCCHLFAGMSGMMPQTFFGATQSLNQGIGYVSRGTMNPFGGFIKEFGSKVQGEWYANVARHMSDALSGFGRATDAVQGVYNDRKNSHQAEHSSKENSHKLRQEETTPEVQSAGSKVDDSKRQIDERNNKKYEVFVAMTRS